MHSKTELAVNDKKMLGYTFYAQQINKLNVRIKSNTSILSPIKGSRKIKSNKNHSY